MRAFPIQARTREQLRRMANPAIPGELEAQLGVLYDTQAFTSSTTTLSFFQTLQTSKNLGNLGAAGQIPDPNFFELYGLCLDIIANPTVTAAGSAPAGALQEIQFILYGDAPTTGAEAPYIQLDKNGKIYGPYPLSALHALGGPVGNGWGTETTATTGQYANNGVFDGGLPFNGSIVFTPREVFNWQITWGGTVAVVASHALRLSMVGVYHRKVS